MTPVAALQGLKARLHSIHYEEYGLREMLGVGDLGLLWPTHTPSYYHRCRAERSQRARAALLWLLGKCIPRAWAEELAGSELTGWMLDRGFLREVGEGFLESSLDLTPCMGSYFFHDSRFEVAPIANKVYQLGGDSYTLARLTPRVPGGEALDLCTGSGLHAILAAGHHRRVVGVDRNPRALELSGLNAELNGVSCEWLLGDLYEPVAGQEFDIITINPPFVSSPDAQMEIHRTGGESGEEVARRAVEGLSAHLRPGGTFAMFLTYPVTDQPYLERLRSWLGPGDWGILVLNHAFLRNEDYIAAHLDAENSFDGYRAYLDSYARLGIRQLGYATVLIRRLPAPGGFAVELPSPYPHRPAGDRIERCLSALARPREPWRWRPRWSARVADLWLGAQSGSARVEGPPGALFAPLQLDGTAARVCAMIDGGTSGAAMARRLERSVVRETLALLEAQLWIE